MVRRYKGVVFYWFVWLSLGLFGGIYDDVGV
jgi:hypothetical protein